MTYDHKHTQKQITHKCIHTSSHTKTKNHRGARNKKLLNIQQLYPFRERSSVYVSTCLLHPVLSGCFVYLSGGLRLAGVALLLLLLLLLAVGLAAAAGSGALASWSGEF